MAATVHGVATDTFEAQGSDDEDGQASPIRLSTTAYGSICAVVAVLPLVIVTVVLGVHHWVPTGDDAVISWRSWGVLSRHSPLLGSYSQASSATGIYDPGPLEFWAIALPLRLLPSGLGAVVGVTTVEVLALGSSLVAVARTTGRLAASLVTGGVLLGICTAAPAVTDPVWNANSGLIPFAAVLLLAWAVSMGSFWWWPVMVAFASYSVQAHLMYGPTGLLVTVAAPVIGLALRTPRRLGKQDLGWTTAGLGVGLLVWATALYQQVTGHPGNLASLWDTTAGSSQPTIGWWNGLDEMARGIGPRPAWLEAPRAVATTFFGFFGPLGDQGWTLLGIALVVLVGVLAYRRRLRDVLALALVTLVAVGGGLWALASTPAAKQLVLSYTTWITWPLGMLVWFAVGWGAFRLFCSFGHPGWWDAALAMGRRGAWAVVAALGCLSVAVSIFVAATITRWSPANIYSPASNGSAAVQIADLVASTSIPHGRIHLEVSGDQTLVLAPAIAYQLETRGWQTTLSFLLPQLTSIAQPRPSDAVLAVNETAAAEPHGARRLGIVTVKDPDGEVHHWIVAYVPGVRR